MTIDKEVRQNMILEAIIRSHIDSALPVGSKHIARLLGLSSATIRNAMFELEGKGYIEQPHTSAGRLPTDLGYRRYVDNMMSVKELENDNVFARVKEYFAKKRFFEEIVEAVSTAVSKITNYTGIALSPSNRFYFDGTYHMLDEPEFREADRARNFLKVLEEREELLRIMTEDLETSGTRIRIGRENIFKELRGCTIITSTYKFKNHVSGNIGVIGPMRMRYEEVVPAVQYLAEMTTETLEEIS